MGRLRIDRITAPPGRLLDEAGAVRAARCYRAAATGARLVGLLATPDLAADEALWLAPCASVHAVGLRAPIGCAFLDAEGIVLRVLDPLPRGRLAAVRGARAVVECPAGRLEDLAPGARLVWWPPTAGWAGAPGRLSTSAPVPPPRTRARSSG